MKKLDVIANDNVIAIYHYDEDGLIYHSAALIEGRLFINNPLTFGIGRLSDGYRLATEEEKWFLFEAIGNEGYIEDPNTHLYTKLRASLGDIYYYISDLGEIMSDDDFRNPDEDERFRIGNYALKPEELEGKRDKILKILKGDEGVETTQWISVKDELPFERFKEDEEMTYPVLVRSEESSIAILIMWYSEYKKKWIWADKYKFTPKCWMPIPKENEEAK